MHIFTELLKKDMQPALGCTEPGAIALASAKVRTLSDAPLVSLVLKVNSGIYKNAFTCGIPGTSELGNAFAAALGFVSGDAEKDLCVLENVTEEDISLARALVESGKVQVRMDSISSDLSIRAELQTTKDRCVVEIRGSHTNFCLLEKNGEILMEKDFQAEEEEASLILGATVQEIYDYAVTVPLDEIAFVEEAYRVNGELARAGAGWSRCEVTQSLLRENGGVLISEDDRLSAKTLAAAATEARFFGAGKPAMSITGSGAHGIVCTLPLQAYSQVHGLNREKFLRATAISYLICTYIKEYSGKLSAFCGCGIAGGTGVACGLTYLMGGDEASLERTCNTMAASITGMVCTGGNHCCTMKLISAVDSALNAARLSIDGASISAPHGLCDETAEKTLQNVGRIADPGMVETERVIVEIMQGKGAK